MPGKVIKVERSVTLTFWEKLYIPEIIRGLYTTAKHFFPNFFSVSNAYLRGKPEKRKIMTIYYPEEKPTIPEAYRGRPALVKDTDGREKCVACGLCETACPSRCISIMGGIRDDGSRYPLTYHLDGSRCIFCGLCEEACPMEAIVMSHQYENLTEYDRRRMIYEKEALLVPSEELQKRLDFIRKRAFSKWNY